MAFGATDFEHRFDAMLAATRAFRVRLSSRAPAREYHKLMIYGRVRSTPTLTHAGRSALAEGGDDDKAAGDEAGGALSERRAEGGGRPTCIFWLTSIVPRYSEFHATGGPDGSGSQSGARQLAPRILWRCLARGSLAMIAEQLVPGEMVMVEGTILSGKNDHNPKTGLVTPKLEVLASAVRFDAQARSRNAASDESIEAEEEAVAGAVGASWVVVGMAGADAAGAGSKGVGGEGEDVGQKKLPTNPTKKGKGMGKGKDK